MSECKHGVDSSADCEGCRFEALERDLEAMTEERNLALNERNHFVGCLKGANEAEDTMRQNLNTLTRDLQAMTSMAELANRQRVYYQDIVYSICSSLDRLDGKKPGQGIVCGTADEPNTDVLKRIDAMIASIATIWRLPNMVKEKDTKEAI